ncbi:hypothetical protein NC651_006955 [Populus alba x Populus x berolinensis]|nr:hypothetical protein NC651_006955 [Populus alba x Populus x berolinensis]
MCILRSTFPISIEKDASVFNKLFYMFHGLETTLPSTANISGMNPARFGQKAEQELGDILQLSGVSQDREHHYDYWIIW